jgi:hypothetical protein
MYDDPSVLNVRPRSCSSLTGSVATETPTSSTTLIANNRIAKWRKFMVTSGAISGACASALSRFSSRRKRAVPRIAPEASAAIAP